MLRKVLVAVIIMILVSSMLAYVNNSNPSGGNIKIETPQSKGIFMAYVPANLHYQVDNTLNQYNIKYTYYGNLLNVNYTNRNSQLLNNIFNNTVDGMKLNHFVGNSSTNFVPYRVNSSAFLAGAYSPNNIDSAYNINNIHNRGYYGNNTTIVIVDAYGDPSIRYDISAFDNITGLPPINLSIKYPVGTVTSTNFGWSQETAVDVEWAHAIAPGAKIKLIISPSSGTSLINAVSYAVNNSAGNIISLSWGSAESSMSSGTLNTLNQVYKQAAEKNITVVAASGDSGAKDGTHSLTTNFPASDPYVLGVGGTSLYYHKNGTYTQTAWGCTINGKSVGSGGGYSSYFSKPYYQNPSGYNNSGRGVPDVSMDANPNTGVLVVEGGEQYMVGGTSIATPMWAGIIAILDQYNHKSLGLVNPMLYQISNTKYYNEDFTQITSGNNGGYSAHSGWNPVTGLGTPNVSNLVNDSRHILSSYGSMAIFNGTEPANRISAQISAPSNNADIYNGSTFYYVSLYSNSNNYIEFGISVNSTGYYYSYKIDNNNVIINNETRGNKNAYITLNYTGNNITFSANNKSIWAIKNILIPFKGNYRAATGAQQENSPIDFVNISSVTISDIGIYNNTGKINYTGIYETHYSNVGASYGLINITKVNNHFTVQKSNNITSGAISNNSQEPVILYNITYGLNSTVNLYLNNGQKTNFYLNGKKLNDPVSLPGGYYTINTTINGKNISREIYIPGIKEYNLNIHENPSYYKASINMVTDYYFTNSTNQNHTEIFELPGENNIKLNSDGYKTLSENIQGNYTVNMTPEKIKIDIFVYNGNITTTFNGKTINVSNGNYISYITPQELNVSIHKAGFKNYVKTFKTYPGKNIYQEVLLMPSTSGYYNVSGTVYNKEFNYTLKNARISDNSSVLGYSNNKGNYILFIPKGKYNLTFSEYLYANYSKTVSVTGNISSMDIYMNPENVSIPNIAFNIQHAIPLGFYYLFLSWSIYPKSHFGEYKVFYSTNSLMKNSKEITIYNRGTDFTFLGGLTPGKTYYIVVSAFSSNGSFISTHEIVVHYNWLYYGLNILIFGGIIAYIILMVKFLFRRKKYEEDDLDFPY